MPSKPDLSPKRASRGGHTALLTQAPLKIYQPDLEERDETLRRNKCARNSAFGSNAFCVTPPEKQEKATQTVLEQAEVLSGGWGREAPGRAVINVRFFIPVQCRTLAAINGDSF